MSVISGIRDSSGQDSFDAHQYLQYLRRRWKFIFIVCVAAGAAALIVSLLLPKQYTATASILIDSPPGNEPRSSTALSPIYLESLRTYELFASSDTLFSRALDKFHLRDAQSSSTLESLKRRLLKVTKLRDTKVLQISATLRDPKEAQALAQFLAQETVNLSREANRAGDQELLDDAQRQSDEAQKRLEQMQTAWSDFNLRQPLEPLRAEMDTLIGLRDRVRKDLLDSRAELAEFTGRAADERTAGVRARVESLEKQDIEISRQIETKAALISRRTARSEELQQQLRTAMGFYDAAGARLRDLRASAGLRGERLRVIDPGVVPERPSFPNIPLNAALALAVALAGCITYLTLTFRPMER